MNPNVARRQRRRNAAPAFLCLKELHSPLKNWPFDFVPKIVSRHIDVSCQPQWDRCVAKVTAEVHLWIRFDPQIPLGLSSQAVGDQPVTHVVGAHKEGVDVVPPLQARATSGPGNECSLSSLVPAPDTSKLIFPVTIFVPAPRIVDRSHLLVIAAEPTVCGTIVRGRKASKIAPHMKVKCYFTFMTIHADAIYELAEGQSGYFTTTQAAAKGISRQLLRHHIAAGTIQRVAHGIYRLARFPSQPFEDIVIAALWAGPDSVASHETALTIHRLSDAMPNQIHLTLPYRFRGQRAGVVIHNAPINNTERTRRDNVAVTTAERTLIDVALRSDPTVFRSALRDALEQGMTTDRRLQLAIANHPDAEIINKLIKQVR